MGSCAAISSRRIVDQHGPQALAGAVAGYFVLFCELMPCLMQISLRVSPLPSSRPLLSVHSIFKAYRGLPFPTCKLLDFLTLRAGLQGK